MNEETDEKFIDCKCPSCGEAVSFREDAAWGVEKCPNCTEDLVVPGDGNETAGKIPVPITTPRLVLRRLAATDWEDLVEFLSDEELFQYVQDGPFDEKEVVEWLASDRRVKLTTPGTTFSLAIELQSKAKVIGTIYLHSTDEFRSQTNVRIYVSRKFQRQGFATEALKAVLEFCFDSIALHRVSAWCDSRNIAACCLAAKAGMRREGELIKERFVNDEWINTVLYALLNEEYRNE
ncbi:MAG TPA: GNAT family protein [Verrucomicrobiae bacterium]|jgi:RimJ/RimL family protein N-acetyltransferase